METTMTIRSLVACGLLAFTTVASAQTGVAARGTVERIKIHGRSLEGNLEGDSPDRDVMVYLPPTYTAGVDRRYPVVYLLHGFTDDVDHWWGVVRHFVSVPQSMDRALESGVTKELILVMPNAYTRYEGIMYSNSATTGNWEDYLVAEMVPEIDRRYRTIADVRSRGLAGHSMGGYGAIRIGMRHPDVFSSVYVMSACCLVPPTGIDRERGSRAEAVENPADVHKADFGTKAILASAAAWSPNPNNPPLYLDLPTKDGQPRPDVLAKWAANAPLAMIDQYIANLKRLHAIAVDVGSGDGLAPASARLDEILTAYAIPHAYETYDGNHINRVAERLETKVFRFFTEHLRFEQQERGAQQASAIGGEQPSLSQISGVQPFTTNSFFSRYSRTRSRRSPWSSMVSSDTVPPVPQARLSSWQSSLKKASFRGRPATTVTVLPPRPFFSMRSFATTLPGREGSDSPVARVLHLQSRTGQPQPGHTRPTSVE
jgi:S-formylglutathione hydrolase